MEASILKTIALQALNFVKLKARGVGIVVIIKKNAL
jgi:hypothetical protein